MINEFKGKYYFLSNFSESLVSYDGLTYYNVEAAFQAAKTLDKNERIKFAREKNPSVVKKMGRKILLRPDWEEVKADIMYELVFTKFNSNPDLKKQLLETGTEELIEGNYWHDNIWGHCTCEKCKNKEHQNRLGKILMKVRSELS